MSTKGKWTTVGMALLVLVMILSACATPAPTGTTTTVVFPSENGQATPVKTQRPAFTPGPALATPDLKFKTTSGQMVVAIPTTPGSDPISPDTINCKEQMWGPFPLVKGGYDDLPFEVGGPEGNTTFILGHVWFPAAAAPYIKIEKDALWRVSPDPVQLGTNPNDPNKVGIVFVMPGFLNKQVHFAGSMGGVAWQLCRSVSMKVNNWTVQNAFEEVSEAADKYAAELDAQNRTGTNAQVVYRANFPRAIKDMVGLLNCVTPGEYGVAQCSGAYQPKPGETPGAVAPTAAVSGSSSGGGSAAAVVATPFPTSNVAVATAAQPQPTAVMPAATAKPAATSQPAAKCDPVEPIAGSASFTAKGPEVVVLFSGTAGKLVTYVAKGQTLSITAPFNYTRFVFADSCASQAEALAKVDGVAPDGRKFLAADQIPGISVSGTAAPAVNVPAAATAPQAVVVVAPAKSSAAQMPATVIDDPRADGFKAVVKEVGAGTPHWHAKSVYWYPAPDDPAGLKGRKSSGMNPCFWIDVIDSAGKRLVDIPLKISWPGGSETTKKLEAKPGEPYGFCQVMTATGPYFTGRPNDGKPADEVSTGLGAIGAPKMNYHSATGVVWVWWPGTGAQ